MQSFSTRAIAILLLAAGAGSSAKQIPPRIPITAAPTATATAAIAARAEESLTVLSNCHKHSTNVFCEFGTTELQVIPATTTGEPPAQYTDCHSHGEESFCVDPNGQDVEVLGYESHDDHSHGAEESGGVSCHFHAGVEHCIGGDEEEGAHCDVQSRDYNIGLRIGLIFVMLVVSLIGSAGPVLLAKVLPPKMNLVFIVVKQFGTGIILSTAFVHLFTHATLMFTNECLGELKYEATTAAVVMAGIVVSFLAEYVGHRVARAFFGNSQYNEDVASVLVLESGIVFHSILIGVTVVVAGDSYFATLFIVIVFHQLFEGIALGSRIAAVGKHVRTIGHGHHHHHHQHGMSNPIESDKAAEGVSSAVPTDVSEKNTMTLSLPKMLALAATFSLTTPIGMAIGTGVLHSFNGNDPSTLIAIGTLDAFSAGILVWVGVVEMLASDWMFGGELERAKPWVASVAGLALVSGIVVMSVLGKWA